MRSVSDHGFLVAVPLLFALSGCQGSVGGGNERHAGPGASGGTGSGGGGSVTLPPGTQTAALLPARIRRLSNAEFENSVRDVVGNTAPVTTDFVPDARQDGFTVNDAQIVDSVLIKQISGAASILAAQLAQQLTTKAPCTDPVNAGEACAQAFIQSFATRAYRRPLGADEAAQLLVLYHAGADGAAYADGITEVATGVLQSAAFLYLTETGGGATGSVVSLTPQEIAAEMSYLLDAAPPSAALLASAVKGDLATPEGRYNAINAQGLLGGSPPTDRFVRIIREWLGTDRLADTAKDTIAYPSFAALKPAMVAETTQFVFSLVTSGNGTVEQLLGANWTATTDPGLATLYGAAAAGTSNNPKVMLPARRGILNQGAFLSVYAHASETGPVLRGVALLRRVTCVGVQSPTKNITVVPLVPDPTKTTRARLTAHVTDPVCAGCHTSIDSMGLAFELYDGMGALQTQDYGQPVDSSATIAVGKDFDGTYPDSNALALALSKSPSVRECFARNIFRASSGRSDDTVTASEDDFIQYWKTQSATATKAAAHPSHAADGDIVDTVLSYIESPTFTLRRAQ